MRPDDLVRLKHMHDATVSALRFVDVRSRQDLDSDEMLLFAWVRAVEVIGEAASKVSAAGHADLLDIRWAAIVTDKYPCARSAHRAPWRRSQSPC
jgi:uncharacterized protein with HEPN domain